MLRPGYTSDLATRLIESAETAPAPLSGVLILPTYSEARAAILAEHVAEALGRWHHRQRWFRVEHKDRELLAAWLVSTLEIIQKPGERLAWQTHRVADLLAERSARAWQPLTVSSAAPAAA